MNINRVSNQPKFTGAYTLLDGNWINLLSVGKSKVVPVSHIREELSKRPGLFLKLDSDSFLKGGSRPVGAIIDHPLILTQENAKLYKNEDASIKDFFIKNFFNGIFNFEKVTAKDVSDFL